MARNKLAGSKRGKSKSARYYQENPEARAKKDKYNTKYHKTKEARDYRAFLGTLPRAPKGYNNAHVGKGKKTVVQKESTNKANNRPKYKSTKKRGLKSLLRKRKK